MHVYEWIRGHQGSPTLYVSFHSAAMLCLKYTHINAIDFGAQKYKINNIIIMVDYKTN